MNTRTLSFGTILVLAISADLGCGGSGEIEFPTGTAGGTGTDTAGSGGDTAATGGAGTGASGGEAPAGGAGGSGATGGAGTGATGGGTSTGTGGAPAVCEPEADFTGDPVTGDAGSWVWVDVPEAKCRTGSSTGFGVRLNPASDKLFIFFEGGGACFNSASCFGNSGSYSAQNFNSWKNGGGQSGVFDTDNAGNALADYNAVYIPYCTGDVHAGNATGVNVEGIGAPQNQSFVGFKNVGYFLQRIVPTFPNVKKVVVTGVSAGGFGAAFNFHRIAQAFCPTESILIDDSGPPMDDQFLAPCLQKHWRLLWGMNGNFPADCGQCTPADGGGILNYMDYLGKRYPGGRLALISSMEDGTIRQFYGFGQNDCQNLDGFPASLPADVYTAGLNDLRTNHQDGPAQWASFYLEGTTHTYLGGNSYTTTTAGGVKLIDWVGDIVNDGPMENVGP